MKDAPSAVHRGSAATHNSMVYITPFNSNSVYQYIVHRDKWQTLPSCPYRNAGLVIIDGALTAVGGREGTLCTSRAFTLHHGSWVSSSKWVERYPPMPTARSDPAVISYVSDDRHTNVIVIGGWGDGGWSTTVVELLKTDTQSWYQLSNLPKPIMQPSAAICGGSLYVIKQDASGFSCSLKELLTVVHVQQTKPKAVLRRTRSWSSIQINATPTPPSLSPIHITSPPITPTWSPSKLHSVSTTQSGFKVQDTSWSPVQSTPTTPPWSSLPHLPVRKATVSTLCGKLVIIGGQRFQDGSGVSSIYQLLHNKWTEIGSMNCARSMCFALCPVPYKIVIVGGSSDHASSLKCTELCTGS